jgi:hypothetical protein
MEGACEDRRGSAGMERDTDRQWRLVPKCARRGSACGVGPGGRVRNPPPIDLDKKNRPIVDVHFSY